MRSQGVSSTLELGRFVPNLVSMNNTGVGSANAFYLRGLGNTETIPTFDPPVGTYVDEIYLSRQNANNINLFDVERVEVLRGPQGTLFGRNTTGGAVNVILKEPARNSAASRKSAMAASTRRSPAVRSTCPWPTPFPSSCPAIGRMTTAM
nr:Plug domain-containing protein [Sphingobium chungbukense]